MSNRNISEAAEEKDLSAQAAQVSEQPDAPVDPAAIAAPDSAKSAGESAPEAASAPTSEPAEKSESAPVRETPTKAAEAEPTAPLKERLGLDKFPQFMRSLKNSWLVITVVIALLFAIAIALALGGARVWAIALGVIALALLLLTNFWFRERVTSPILGLGDTAKHIAEGGYGTLAEKLRDDEVGALTESINDMSVKIAETSRTQRDFVSSVSHELRTPLTAIRGWSETLLYDEALQGDSRRGIEIIANEAYRLTVMVEGLLEFTRLRDGRFSLSLDTVDMAALLEEVDFTYRELLRHDNITLTCSLPKEGLPEVTGDAARLKQVVLNILDNAVKHARRGRRIELSAACTGEFISVSVRDHGPGVNTDDLPHVKERFYKGRGRERGSGIGLAVCDEIVTLHGGTLTVANAEGGGAIVTFTLPVRTQ